MRDTPLLRKGVNKVALRLFEHNEKAYHAAIRMMEQYGKAPVVHPDRHRKELYCVQADRGQPGEGCNLAFSQ